MGSNLRVEFFVSNYTNYRRGKKVLNLSRDKMQGTYRSGGGRRAYYVTSDLSYDEDGAGQEARRK